MQLINQIETIQQLSKAWSKQGKTIAFVPTMGNLHTGHLSLIQQAQTIADKVVISIFVNPLQFAPHEDYDRYPRTLESDLQKLEPFKVDAVFTPTAIAMYPHGKQAHAQVFIPELSHILCGITRPHFFQGVATVVIKLFNIVQPTYAIFGEKDFQQLMIIKKCVADLVLPIQIISAPIIRETDGLALSSRNQYLSIQERGTAPYLFSQLQETARSLNSTSLTELTNIATMNLNKN